MVAPEDILELVADLKGVRESFYIEKVIRDGLLEIESRIKGTLGVSVQNDGLIECLDRDYVIAIIKDTSFRPPPESTVLLIGDDDIVMGREVVPSLEGQFEQDEDCIFVSDDFVVFPKEKCKERECFLMPPVPFPELEGIEGVKKVVSCSPSAPGDYFLRKAHGFEDDPKLASILVGFDIS